MTSSVRCATLIGLAAILLWSTTVGILRSITEALGTIGGAALIYSVTALFLCIARGLPHRRGMPIRYLCGGGLLFVAYEIALAIGFATDRNQSLELGMINYLWPCLTILLAIPVNRQPFRWWLWPGLALSLGGILWVMKGDRLCTPQLLWHNIQSNPLAYGLAFSAAIIWALYNNITRRYSRGSNRVTLFFLATAAALWLKFAFTASFSEMHFSPQALGE